MIIDLHVHTRVLSPCSNIDPEEAIQEAMRIGLDGICFTEHDKMWKAEDIRQLREKWNFPIFCGLEVGAREGHILVFGLEESIEGLIPAGELRGMVNEKGGAMIIAHPFRGFLIFGFGDLNMTVQSASQLPVFKVVDAIEVYSGRSTKRENELTRQVSEKIALNGTGGSDAHSLPEIGRCVTIFENTVKDEQELIAELKSGRFRADYFRK